MSETPSNPSANTPVPSWTAEQVLYHLLSVINQNDKRYEQRFEAQAEAVKKAETATEERFKGVNEFRGQLADQQQTFMRKEEASARMEILITRADGNRERIDRLEAAQLAATAERAGIKGGWGYAVAIISFMVTVAALIYTFNK